MWDASGPAFCRAGSTPVAEISMSVNSQPSRTGGGDDGRDDSMPDFIPNHIPNYGERLRRTRMGLAVAMTPIVMLFISFTAVYLIRRGSLSLDLSGAAYIQTWV